MKIVVVEDEASIRNGLEKILPRLDPGYELVGAADNGLEGIELIAHTRPDLVIMDIQMPEMDGLTMLERLRAKGVLCRVVVLTAYSDFSYAKRAIELNIDNYLLKPIKIPELEQTLAGIARELAEEKEQEMLEERLMSLEQIFRGSILAEVPIDQGLNKITMEKYGLNVEEPLVIFGVWLGKNYERCVKDVVQVLELSTKQATDYRCSVMASTLHSMVLVILYQIRDAERIRRRYGEYVVPAIRRGIRSTPAIYSWMECGGLKGMPTAFARLIEQQMWNLSFPSGTLICEQTIRETKTKALKYPFELETLLRQAAASHDQTQFSASFRRFIRVCMGEPHRPEEIREACIRYCIALVNLTAAIGSRSQSCTVPVLVGKITQAVTWEEIGEVLEMLYQAVTTAPAEEGSVSLMVKKAKSMIAEYYNQGITLELVADKLCVTEEYLSAQFKKETGSTFTETVRRFRIDKIKELLLHSSLKLNQIADMVGYSDPKYMSKVFKEEVGMLPAEFRKQV